jgi:hypothetical protein
MERDSRHVRSAAAGTPPAIRRAAPLACESPSQTIIFDFRIWYDVIFIYARGAVSSLYCYCLPVLSDMLRPPSQALQQPARQQPSSMPARSPPHLNLS